MFSHEIIEQEVISQLKAFEELVIFTDEEELQFTHCDISEGQLFEKSMEICGATW